MSLSVTFPHDPKVLFTPEAWADMHYVTKAVKTEVAMLGIATRLDTYQWLVTKMYLPEQDVNGATAEVQPDDFTKFAEWLHQQPGGEEEYLGLRVWQHKPRHLLVFALPN